MQQTDKQFDEVISQCRDIFGKKLRDYGASWRIMRAPSITDQIYIKANRIRSIETKGEAMINEGVVPELIGIVNYAVIGLIQLSLGAASDVDMNADEAMRLYEEYIAKAKDLMMAKNHDYDEAWRLMRVNSYTDFILMKVNRTKQIEDNNGATIISEGIDANYLDMLNYAVFGLIKLTLEDAQ